LRFIAHQFQPYEQGLLFLNDILNTVEVYQDRDLVFEEVTHSKITQFVSSVYIIILIYLLRA